MHVRLNRSDCVAAILFTNSKNFFFFSNCAERQLISEETCEPRTNLTGRIGKQKIKIKHLKKIQE